MHEKISLNMGEQRGRVSAMRRLQSLLFKWMGRPNGTSDACEALETGAGRTEELTLLRQKLATEMRLRARAEQDLATIEKNIIYLHESLPAMLAYVDTQHQLKYHNRAFLEGLGNGVSRIDGCHLRELVGNVVYDELEADLSCALSGNIVYHERLHKSAAGESFRLLMQCLPEFDGNGEVAGIFLLATDITNPEDFALPLKHASPADTSVEQSRPCLVSAVAETEAERDDEIVRLRKALARDEFCLFFQTIEPVAASGVLVPFREILLRLKAEEESMMPPGSFLPVAEEYGMLPDLDRWVVRHLLDWVRADASRQHAVYSVNITAQSLADAAFPAFVKTALRDFALPGSLLCFELKELDVLHCADDAKRFIDQLRPEGCRHAICGFSGNRASLDLLRQVPVNFLKIDGGLILNMRRSAVDLARVKAIQRMAQTIGVSTVAECVEDGKTLQQLRLIGVDFAQGFGISRPQDLRQISLGGTTQTGTESVAAATGAAMAGD